MTRKHFVLIARQVAKIRDRADRIMLANDLACEFARENPRFDRARFLSACGVPVPQTLVAAA